MMTAENYPAFSEHFWGEKNNGFDVLYHNMKYGQDSTKDFSDFLRESCNVEETYSKLLAKLARSTSGFGTRGSFGPFWNVIKVLVEKLSSIHQQLVLTWQDLVKDVIKYNEEQIKKHRAVKEQESGTLATAQGIQQTVSALQKAKELYHVRCFDYEKLKRDPNASPKDLERAESKYKKSNDDYKGYVEKYSTVREEFESKMTESCKRFQELEENHLAMMKDFVDTYAKAWEHQSVLHQQVHEEFGRNKDDLTIAKLVDILVTSKTTGTERPGPIEFIEADLSSLPSLPATTPDSEKRDFPAIDKPKNEKVGDGSHQGSPDSLTKGSILDRTLPLRASTGWFLRKNKKKKKKKEKGEEKKNNEDDKDEAPQVDEEGYSIRPEFNSQNHNDRDSSDTSSDSDDDHTKPIQVRIRPVEDSPNGSHDANMDVIRDVVGTIRLSPTLTRRQTPTNEHSMKKSFSQSESINSLSQPNTSQTRSNTDLLMFDIFASQSSTASTPTGASFGLGSPSPTLANNSQSTPGAGIDLLTGMTGDTPPMVPARRGGNTPTGAPPVLGVTGGVPLPVPGVTGVVPLLAGPPPGSRPKTSTSSTNIAYARPSGRMTPTLSTSSSAAKMERADSVPSLKDMTFNTSAASWSSRGPSPVPMGLSGVIPLAVAFSETVNAYFKGTDEKRCKTKLTGDMMVSFPTGIVKHLTENPSPAALTFRLKNTHQLEHILVNKQLIKEDPSQSSVDGKSYHFDMSVLTDHLRRQSEQNSHASYFNIDILKYQVKTNGILSVPLHVVSYWKVDATSTDVRVDYKYNSAALPSGVSLYNVTAQVPVDGDVKNMQAKPDAKWLPDNHRAVWKLGEVNGKANEGRGSLRAKFDITEGPSTPSPVAVQFLCDGSNLSQVDFDLTGSGYRVSLVKKRFITGKYISEPDMPDIKYV